MREARKPSWISMEKNNNSSDILFEIEQTIAELEIYLETYPDDEIALVQYQQFLNKREEFTFLLAEAYEKSSHFVMQA